MSFHDDTKRHHILVFTLILGLYMGLGCGGEETSEEDTGTTVEDTTPTPDPDVEAVDDSVEETVSDAADVSDTAEIDETDESDGEEADLPTDVEPEVADADVTDESTDGPTDSDEADTPLDVDLEPNFDVTFNEVVDSGPPPSCDPGDVTDICTSVCRGLELCSGGGGGEACITGCEENLADCDDNDGDFVAICACISTHLTCRTYSEWSNCMGEVACVL